MVCNKVINNEVIQKKNNQFVYLKLNADFQKVRYNNLNSEEGGVYGIRRSSSKSAKRNADLFL